MVAFSLSPPPPLIGGGPPGPEAPRHAPERGDPALAFYDAIAPIVSYESVDHDVVFRASRYGKETMPGLSGAEGEGEVQGAYLNCPMTREQYETFLDALTSADKATAHEFDEVPYF